MSDKVQIVCKGCEAKLAMPGTPDNIINRKVRCPKCQMKFVARPEMVRVVTATKAPAKTAPAHKPPRVAEEIIDDDVELLDDDDDELPDIPPPRSSKSKRPPKDDFEDDDDLDDLPISPKKKKDSKPKKKVKKAPTRSFGAAVVLWTLGGIVGGFVGGGVWWTVAYTTGFNVWFLAVLMGTAVGAGVRLGAAQYEGWMPALTAVFITLATLFFTKLTLNYTLYADEIGGLGIGETATVSRYASMTEEEKIAEYIAEVVEPEYRKQGKPIDHPRMDDEDYEDYSDKGMYHPDLWKDAETRWRAMPPQEQAVFQQTMIDKELGIDRTSLIHRIIEKDVKPEFAQQNKPVELTEAELDANDYAEIYTAEALQEGAKRLEAQTPEQRAVLIESIRTEHAAAEKVFANLQIIGILIWTVIGFFWPSNLICTILACISAWQIGNYDGVTT
jgi:DNA-directed RNA polymerase subunit RPC12/RpoP